MHKEEVVTLIPRFEYKGEIIADNFPDYTYYLLAILAQLYTTYPNQDFMGYTKFDKPKNIYDSPSSIPIFSIAEVENLRVAYQQNIQTNEIIRNATSVEEIGFPKTEKDMTILLSVLRDRLTDGFLLSYPHGIVMSQARGNYFYRGENNVFTSSVASVFRTKLPPYPYSHFVSKMRIELLKQSLQKLNFIQEWEYGDILYEAIAQHYGIPTRLLDFTTNLDVALFFACCSYNSATKEYEPFEKPQEKYSMLYIADNGFIENLHLQAMAMQIRVDYQQPGGEVFFHHNADIQPIGFQPFMRCSRQNGYAMYTNQSDNLLTNKLFQKIRIKHNDDFVKFSAKIYDMMDGGKKLFPPDESKGMLKLVDIISESKCFSLDIFNKTFNNFNLAMTKTKIRNTLAAHDIKIYKEVQYDGISNELLALIESAWEKNNFISNGDVVPINRPILKTETSMHDGSEYGFYMLGKRGKDRQPLDLMLDW